VIVERIPTEVYTSNMYSISFHGNEDVWLLDIGNAAPILRNLDQNQVVRGVFLTHAHYDHIQGINDLEQAFPECVFYCAAHTRDSLYSDKLNLSFYHEQPIIYAGTNIKILVDEDEINLCEHTVIKVIATPGHNPGCLSYKLNNYLFTGDSWIPGIPVVTKLKGGNKSENVASLKRLFQEIDTETIICPGHGEIVQLPETRI